MENRTKGRRFGSPTSGLPVVYYARCQRGAAGVSSTNSCRIYGEHLGRSHSLTTSSIEIHHSRSRVFPRSIGTSIACLTQRPVDTTVSRHNRYCMRDTTLIFREVLRNGLRPLGIFFCGIKPPRELTGKLVININSTKNERRRKFSFRNCSGSYHHGASRELLFGNRLLFGN